MRKYVNRCGFVSFKIIFLPIIDIKRSNASFYNHSFVLLVHGSSQNQKFLLSLWVAWLSVFPSVSFALARACSRSPLNPSGIRKGGEEDPCVKKDLPMGAWKPSACSLDKQIPAVHGHRACFSCRKENIQGWKWQQMAESDRGWQSCYIFSWHSPLGASETLKGQGFNPHASFTDWFCLRSYCKEFTAALLITPKTIKNQDQLINLNECKSAPTLAIRG